MLYQRDTNVKKSLIQWITNTIDEDGVFYCGDGSSMISVYDEFPVNPTEFKIPSLSIDFDRTAPRGQYDLGKDALYPYDVEINMWFSNKIGGEYVSSILKDDVETSQVAFRDYNLNINGACILSYMEVKDIETRPMRVEMPGFEQDYRHQMTFSVELKDVY